MNELGMLGFGIASGGVLRHAERQPVAEEEFFSAAGALLPNLADVVQSGVIPRLEEAYGRWHPSGFMVFPLGTHSELGTLRLHIWPDRERRRQVKGRGYLGADIYDGDIHNHRWHIKSVTLVSYRDRFYAIQPQDNFTKAADSVEHPDDFRVFRVAYESENPEMLTTDGSCVRADSVLDRSLRAGEMHEIRVGQFHAPVLPDDEFGATLVISSFRVDANGPDVLLGGTAQPIVGNRQDVTAEEARMAKDQFLGVFR